MTTVGPRDHVVLLDADVRPVGTMARDEVHGPDTPLHLAFSLYLFDPAGRLLVTRRALGKRTWPGVWTNSCCGHVRPDETVEAAASRRVEEELSLAVPEPVAVLPDFRYRAVAPDGIVENEVCPVFAARVDRDPRPDPDEVAEWRWVDWVSFREAAVRTPWLISPWAARQSILLPVDVPVPA